MNKTSLTFLLPAVDTGRALSMYVNKNVEPTNLL